MRKIKVLVLMCLSVVTFSCSSDDSSVVTPPVTTPTDPTTEEPTKPDPDPETPPVKVDQIVGSWRIDGMFVNDSETPLTDCEKTAVIIFAENNLLDEEAVDYDCTVITEERKGTWEKGATANLYKIRTHEDSFNAFYNDVEWTKVSVEGNVMTTVCDIDHPFLGTYTLTLKLVKKADSAAKKKK